MDWGSIESQCDSLWSHKVKVIFRLELRIYSIDGQCDSLCSYKVTVIFRLEVRISSIEGKCDSLCSHEGFLNIYLCHQQSIHVCIENKQIKDFTS